MKRTIWIALCSIILGCSCTSSEEKHIKILMHELGIEFTNPSDSNYVVIIPGNGCESCIQSAINEMQESEDTAYVFICDSEKEFYLQSGGKKASSFRNLRLDKKGKTAQFNMIQTYPNVYLLIDGHLISKTPYQSKKQLITKQKQTIATISMNCIDFGKIEFSKTYKDSIYISNIGQAPLYINQVYSSCECTKVEFSSKVIAPSERGVFYVTFQPDVKGEIERFIYIDCNIKEKSLEIPIKGIIY